MFFQIYWRTHTHEIEYALSIDCKINFPSVTEVVHIDGKLVFKIERTYFYGGFGFHVEK